MTYLLIILLGILSAWEEVQQLVQRGSWKREDYRYPEWKTPYNSIWKNFDSHHTAFGAFVVVMSLSFYFIKLDSIWYTPLVWLGFFYVRNIAMHIIFKKKPIYSYLLFWKMK